MKKISLWLGASGAIAVLLTVAQAKVLITAAGATFPYPIYAKWFDEFSKKYPDAEINYQSIGSGGGIRQLAEGTVDFGASDMPLRDEQIAKMTIKPLHFPTVLGGVVPTYNLPGVSQEVKFTPEALAGIYLGKITKWNDPALAKVNPGVNLPNQNITVVHRSDASGTTFVFTDYLFKISPEWKSRVGADVAVKWPVGLGAKGNEGVAGTVKQAPHSIGYVELIYAIQNKMGYGAMRNSAGKFLKADLASVTAAAAGAARNMPADFRISITDAPGENAYPISSFTYLLIPSKIPDAAKRKTIIEFLHWMLTTGQTYTASLGYAPLPKAVVAKEEKAIALIQ
jgi:phosphate transport system substrate-binding protein